MYLLFCDSAVLLSRLETECGGGSGTTSVLSSDSRLAQKKEIAFAFVEDIDFFFLDHSLIVILNY